MKMPSISFKIKGFYRMLLAGFIGGTLSVLYMTILWNLLGKYFLIFTEMPYIQKLIFDSPGFSLEETIIYNAQNFFVAFVLAIFYYYGSRMINKNESLGVIFYSLFASFAFIFFTAGSMFLAEDVNALLMLFMLDDLFQSIFLMVPIVLLAPKRMGAMMGD